MANMPNQKLRLLLLMKLFLTRTSEDRGLSTQQAIIELGEYGVVTERKSVYRDIKVLKEFGFDIAKNRSREWYLKNRPFSAEELMMLVDAVQSAAFLTEDLTEELVGKLQRFASDDLASVLDQKIDKAEYVKMNNPEVFQTMSVIQKARSLGKQVEFQYFHYDSSKRTVLRKGGSRYVTTPLRLVYAEDRYYLLTFNEYYENMTPYRVDRMLDARVSELDVPKSRQIATWQLEDDVRLAFGVFGCEVESVVIEVTERYVSAVIDKFGLGSNLYMQENGNIRAHVKAPLSPQFYGWLFQLGDEARLIGPRQAVEEYKDYLNSVLSIYEEA